MKNILVTGGRGFIGEHTTKLLVERGFNVTVYDLVDGDDIQHPIKLDAALMGIDGVIHLAAKKSIPNSVEEPIEFAKTNVLGTIKLLDACVKRKIKKVVFASSSSVYNPRNPYAASKLAGEQYCSAFYHTYGLANVRLRYFNVYGPGQDGRSGYAAVIPSFIHKLKTGERPVIYGTGEQRRDFTYVKDVARANVEALLSVYDNDTFDVGSKKNYSVNEVLAEISTHFYPNAPEYLPERQNDVAFSMADKVMFKTEYTLSQGIEEMVNEDLGARVRTY